jgi:hypothetical protein
MTNTNQPKTHRGSCLCRAVTYEAVVDATAGTRCNCTFCTKLNPLGANIKPDAFKLLTGQDKLGRYGAEMAGRFFCTSCGVYVYGAGDIPEIGGAFVSVNFQTLDDIDLRDVSVMYWDGRHDNWQAGLRSEPWPIFTGNAATRSA